MSVSDQYIPFAQSGLRPLGHVQYNRVPPYYNGPVPTWQPHPGWPNACGASAMATLLTYWGKLPIDATIDYRRVFAIYESPDGKPDFVGGLFGTSVERVRDYTAAHGIHSMAFDSRSTVASIDGKYEWLRDWVNNGYPAAVILDLGPLGSPNAAHWAVVCEVEQARGIVQVANFDTHAGQKVAGVEAIGVDAFMKGWEFHIAGPLSPVHFAAVIGHV